MRIWEPSGEGREPSSVALQTVEKSEERRISRCQERRILGLQLAAGDSAVEPTLSRTETGLEEKIPGVLPPYRYQRRQGEEICALCSASEGLNRAAPHPILRCPFSPSEHEALSLWDDVTTVPAAPRATKPFRSEL